MTRPPLRRAWMLWVVTGTLGLLPSLAWASMVEASSVSGLAVAGAPVLRRAIVALIGLLGGFALCLQGWDRFDHRRLWQGLAFVAGGWILGIGGLALLRLSAYPSTWSWWL